MLPKRRLFYSKRLFILEAVRKLSSFSGYRDVHMRVRVGDVIEPAMLRRNVAYRKFFLTVARKFRVKKIIILP